jgi:pimeloyl-ACP methyl ester carboxylesterase
MKRRHGIRNAELLVARFGAAVILVLLLVGGAGAAYNALSIRHYRKLAGVPGKLYDVDGYSMHLYCTGHGSPTIVLSSGLGDDFTSWAKIQPDLSRLTTVCSYDRAGFGWSDSRPGVQDANAIASQLHKLLDAAGVQRPFVLVGHSISGIYLRSYAGIYPQELAGLVFLDGATPLQDDRIPKELRKIQEDQRRQMPREKLLMMLGWYRLQGVCTSIPPGFEAYRAWIKADSCVPSQIDAMENELDAERASGEETIHAGPFGTIPVLILSRDPNVLPSNWPAPVAKANAVVWNEMQDEAKGLSSQSRRIIAKGSDHYIQNDRSDLVKEKIGSFVAMVNNRHGFSSNHSTSEE